MDINSLPRRFIDTRTRKLVDFSNRPIPSYAILSHRWLAGEEVSYEEFLAGLPQTKQKLGYRKIFSACKQALEDGHRYIWVDTCCINKSDCVEYRLAIGSMFSYYQNSAVCYAYLADVWKDGPGTSYLDHTFVKSDWFKRGWTLQELVAPEKMIFYGWNWKFIGSKSELTDSIEHITGINAAVLQGTIPVHAVDIRERLEWIAGRETTQAADRAYCLLGILGLEMDADYSEDADRAFQRLNAALAAKYPDFQQFEDDKHILRALAHQNARTRVGLHRTDHPTSHIPSYQLHSSRGIPNQGGSSRKENSRSGAGRTVISRSAEKTKKGNDGPAKNGYLPSIYSNPPPEKEHDYDSVRRRLKARDQFSVTNSRVG
ncbi:hypothetical protein D9758_003392 [Tetrapyrgos nigripes]|uniref:Heterokaryon incompatibility domain-containing protein n=1 Tax=Tetrapyrgos nigripes TaxID=182062 RepID=A0A8H5GVH4_9AGAR|nr:hypothetical protein D9758_003392 [Tetrapyrgos nigripes]